MRHGMVIGFVIRFAIVTLPLFGRVQVAYGQEPDQGIGFVVLPGGDNSRGVIYSRPSPTSDTIATLFRWEYTFFGDTDKVRGRLAGFEKYGDWGPPIISFSADSSWARVLMETATGEVRRKGWVNLKIAGTSIRLWSDFLPTHPMKLKDHHPFRFYSKPNGALRKDIKLVRYPHQEVYSYVLRPIKRMGRWLYVEIIYPTWPCAGTPSEVKDMFGVSQLTTRVWIEYVDRRGRPLVVAADMC